MSDSDSFIEEVSDAVRRDRLYGLLRRYGWIGILAVVAIVAGTAWQSWQSERVAAQSQAFGDALGAALALQDPTARSAVLEGITPHGADAAAVVTLLQAAADAESGALSSAVERLDFVIQNPDLIPLYRDIALFKRILLADIQASSASRDEVFAALSQPGHPLRLLAEEQLALQELGAGQVDAARARLARLADDAEATPDMRRRVDELAQALPGTLQDVPNLEER